MNANDNTNGRIADDNANDEAITQSVPLRDTQIVPTTQEAMDIAAMLSRFYRYGADLARRCMRAEIEQPASETIIRLYDESALTLRANVDGVLYTEPFLFQQLAPIGSTIAQIGFESVMYERRLRLKYIDQHAADRAALADEMNKAGTAEVALCELQLTFDEYRKQAEERFAQHDELILACAELQEKFDDVESKYDELVEQNKDLTEKVESRDDDIEGVNDNLDTIDSACSEAMDAISSMLRRSGW